MQNNTQTFSTQKIIMFVVFISAAIMTSLFIFHLKHAPAKSALSPDDGMIFSVARDIKSFELTTDNNAPFTEKNFRNHWTLLFFGFTHCASICPTTLDIMNRAYSKLQPTYPDLQVVLISLDPERDTAETLAKYTHSFNANFIGATGKIQELRKLQSQLGIFSARDAAPSTNYQIQHTSSILLINPQGQWAGLFKYGLNPEQFAQAVKTGIQALSSHVSNS